ncbi:hypothetical protein C0Q70_11039 [Pomacea canaliculata]|uniref:C-type lectin domain-containing protein n=1 Tax=Pomacea canaliculata TaxID=400727 RepID=A0A2T7P4V7_POMCA|nr:hypothetical protein C0Q70_11039 [Pomacea canaliculata]
MSDGEIRKDPSGLLLASTGFSEQFFTLKLPVNIAKSGNYCCQLDCGGPNYCCLDDRSPLRQCAQVDVQTGGNDKQEARYATPSNLTSLEQRVSEMDVILRELNVTSLLQRVSEVDVLVRELRSEKVGQDCGHSSAAAMAHLVHRQAKCDQLDSFIDRVDAAEMKFEKDFEGVDRIVKYMQDQLDSMNQTMTDLQKGVGHDYSLDNHQLTTNMSDQFEDYISRMDVIDKKFSSLDKTLNDHRLQCNEETMKIKTTLQNEVSRLKLIDDRILKLDDRMSNVDDWMSKSSDYQSQMTRNLTTIGQDVVAIKMAADHGVSATKSKVTSLEKDLYAYINRCNSSCLDFNALKGCPQEKGYRLFGKRCLKLYTLKKSFTEAKLHCEADGAHLVHLKSRDIDLPPFISLMAANGRQKSGSYYDGLWIGATDILTEGNFQWSDGTELSTDSDLWGNGEPNDKHDDEDCVHVLYWSFTVLNDANCSSEYDFVCQTDLHFAT